MSCTLSPRARQRPVPPRRLRDLRDGPPDLQRLTTLRMLPSGSLNQATLISPETCTSPCALRVRQIVVLEPDALGLERAHHVIYIVNWPGQGRCFIRAGIARPIHVNPCVAVLEHDAILSSSAPALVSPSVPS